MTENPNFDSLAQKSFAPEATSDDYEKLFGAAFALSEWHFISTAEFPKIAAYCAVFPGSLDNLPMVAAFTDTERLRKFINERNLSTAPQSDAIILSESDNGVKFSPDKSFLSVLPENFLGYIEKLLGYGVQGIFFNPNTDSHGFFIALAQLRPIREHLESKNMLTRSDAENIESPAETEPQETVSGDVNFDALSTKATQTNAMEDLNALFGAAFALPEWQFIARGEMPNVYPYVASNAGVADNQPMIRAFTDGKRLIRFARENNLTRADGSCDSLTIPTGNIIEYLEGFIPQGAYGVWFNSDTESDGFFIPLKQLRPIKEHLAKLDQLPKIEANQTVTTLIVQIKDGLGFPSGFVEASDYTCHVFCRVPPDWIEGEQLKPEHLEKIYAQFYGANWRAGNSDGSRYVVQDSYTKVFPVETVKTTKFGGTVNDDKNHFWFYIADQNGEVRSVTAEEFQADIDASTQSVVREEARQEQDRLADFGMSQTADGEFDLNLNINQVGAVNFETSIAPFYEAIVPLLMNYQGTGEYVTLLAFAPSGMSQLVEDVSNNVHGAYLQIRRFLYLNPKNNVRIGVNSLHSRYLRHVQTNAELIVSIELCKNLDNQTGVFYHRFEGPKSEVFKLQAAIQPILESVGYEAVQ